ncbi:MAG: DUF456 domain-containing protein [Planctomycetes bacterium]|nr:DUF456 domain-containing protein [Planctomycetota bacterium]
MNWQEITAASVLTIACIAGIALAAITLPGAWIALALALLAKLWQPQMFSWWTLGAALALALLGEAVELVASAAGASKGGASKKGALGAIAGSLIGAVAGAPFIFPIGSIAGAAIGAGVGALLVERAIAERTWGQSAKAGAGAAVGRLVATMAKTAIASGVALIISVAAWVP